MIRPYLCGEMTDTDAEIYRLIIDGAFDRAIANRINPAEVIELLRRLS